MGRINNPLHERQKKLLDGGNLLGLLEQHGYDARIDVEEAREKMD
jgi:hypothetical protein